MAKFELVFVLTQKNFFSKRFHYKANRKSMSFLKNHTRDFQNSPPFERLAYFYVTIAGNFEPFQYSNFETNLLKKENLFQNTGATFLVESIRIEKAPFPYITALSEANLKTYRMTNTKWTYLKERNFALPVTTLFFQKFCFSLRTSYKE